jgi:hypothetical protein
MTQLTKTFKSERFDDTEIIEHSEVSAAVGDIKI